MCPDRIYLAVEEVKPGLHVRGMYGHEARRGVAGLLTAVLPAREVQHARAGTASGTAEHVPFNYTKIEL